jgi:predicted MFS family arabinose efflux permease
MTTAATLAAAEWVPEEHRTRALSWTLVGQPAAWIVGMPLVGVLGGWSWRYGWLALPLTASVVAAVLVVPRRHEPPASVAAVSARAVLADGALTRWLASDLLANAAWAGTLVYAGALFAESYATSSRANGFLLALAAAAYVAGNLASRRLVVPEPRRTLLAFSLLLAGVDVLFGLARPGPATSAALLAGTAIAAGGRTLVTASFALGLPPEVRPAATSLRAATMQLGYFAGSLAGGAALALGGYGALGATMGALFLGSAGVLASQLGAVRPAGASPAPR